MNIFKRLMVATAFLCMATIVNAEEGIRVGARIGYSMQSVMGGMGMLGLGAGLAVEIPAGPVVISPEVAFLHRNNWSSTKIVDVNRVVDWTQPESVISIPIMIKFFPKSSYSLGIGAQIDIPIVAEECLGSDCVSMDGKEPGIDFSERADFDVGIILSSSYRVASNFAIDFRYIYGITPHHTYVNPVLIGKIKSNPLSSYGFGITYFFL